MPWGRTQSRDMGNSSVTWFSALTLVPSGEPSLLALLFTRSTTSLSSFHAKRVSAFAAWRCLPQHADGRDPASFLFSEGKVAAALLPSVVTSVPGSTWGLRKRFGMFFLECLGLGSLLGEVSSSEGLNEYNSTRMLGVCGGLGRAPYSKTTQAGSSWTRARVANPLATGREASVGNVIAFLKDAVYLLVIQWSGCSWGPLSISAIHLAACGKWIWRTQTEQYTLGCD